MKGALLTTILGAGAVFGAQTVLAFDETCMPLIRSSEAKIAAPAWHAVSRFDEFETEVIKANGKFYMKTAGTWMVSPMNLDDAERKTIETLRSGGIKVTGCTDAGEERVENVSTRALVYTIEIPGSGIPPARTRINVGTDDNLPYRLSSVAGETRQETTYRYTGVKAPL